MLQCVFLPRSREEVEVISLGVPPDKANAGGCVEGHQGFDDDVALCSGCRDKKQGAEHCSHQTWSAFQHKISHLG